LRRYFAVGEIGAIWSARSFAHLWQGMLFWEEMQHTAGSVEAACQMQVVSLQRFAMPIEMAEEAFANDLCG
jgi:hypothetical protein